VPDGDLRLIEATSRFNDLSQFKKDLQAIGFYRVISEELGDFTSIWAMKSDCQPLLDIRLKF
jgi:hypothetical protein